MIQWRIYYSDGSVFDNGMGAPEDAPGRDVQIVSEAEPNVGREMIYGADFYVYDLERFNGWVAVEHFGLWDYLSRPGLKIVKFGKMLRHEEFNAVLIKALDDPDLPVKSAWFHKEPGAPD